MNLACKNALLRARRRPPDLPRRGADPAGARGAGAGRPGGADHAAGDRPAGGVDARRAEATAGGEAAGDHRRPRLAFPHGGGDRAGRAARRAGDHHLQGQGPDRRRPSARRRRARPQRHPGRELGDERGRHAAGARRLLLQPHRDLPRPPDRPGRLRPDAAGQIPPVEVPVWGEIGVVVERLRDELPGRRVRDRGPGSAARRALGDLAGREGQPRRRRPRRRRQLGRRSSRRWSARSRTTR